METSAKKTKKNNKNKKQKMTTKKLKSERTINAIPKSH